MMILISDGIAICCKVCFRKGKKKGMVNMCHKFSVGVWEDHCVGKKHQAVVANIEAKKKKKYIKEKK